ncbi:MAG: hypothetical protein ACRBCI_01980 [Cellvibrionaceae bacterium]
MDKQSLEELKEIIEFGKYGFMGTLISALAGMTLIFALAALSAFTKFTISGWELVSMAFILLAGTIAFGILSLRKLPQLNLNIKDGQLEITTTIDQKKTDNSEEKDDI